MNLKTFIMNIMNAYKYLSRVCPWDPIFLVPPTGNTIIYFFISYIKFSQTFSNNFINSSNIIFQNSYFGTKQPVWFQNMNFEK